LKGKKQADSSSTCEGCYRWEQWGSRCSYYWDKKKECGSKVTSHEDMIVLDQLRRR
jgi:hypothetical protein